jgi:hypothetical protein
MLQSVASARHPPGRTRARLWWGEAEVALMRTSMTDAASSAKRLVMALVVGDAHVGELPAALVAFRAALVA